MRLLPAPQQARLRITQQARREDEADVRRVYEEIGIPAEVSPFFSDMAARIGRAHMVISRSGASTVSEICVIGRPAVLVPYPYALDHDQAANAERLTENGGAILARQSDLSPETLAQRIRDIAEDPDFAESMARAARSVGIPDAAAQLADLLEDIARNGSAR